MAFKKGCVPWNKGKKCPQLSMSKKGKKNSFYGRKHSEETKRKMSAIKKGKNNTSYGKTPTDETRAKIRAARLKQVFPKRDSSIEIALQNELDKLGIPYKTHISVCDICQPDIVFPEKKVVVQCDGNYWHSKDFDGGKVWRRDRYQDKVLKDNGWSVLRFWGSEIRDDVSSCVDVVEGILVDCL